MQPNNVLIVSLLLWLLRDPSLKHWKVHSILTSVLLNADEMVRFYYLKAVIFWMKVSRVVLKDLSWNWSSWRLQLHLYHLLIYHAWKDKTAEKVHVRQTSVRLITTQWRYMLTVVMWLKITSIWNIALPDNPRFLILRSGQSIWKLDLASAVQSMFKYLTETKNWSIELPRISKNNFPFMECFPTHFSERLFSSGKNRLPVARGPFLERPGNLTGPK